jgi:hypothetical protein
MTGSGGPDMTTSGRVAVPDRIDTSPPLDARVTDSSPVRISISAWGLDATGKDLQHLQPEDLGMLEDVDNFTTKARNLTRALANGQLRAIQALAQPATQPRLAPEA